jgi:hypothetical protein
MPTSPDSLLGHAYGHKDAGRNSNAAAALIKYYDARIAEAPEIQKMDLRAHRLLAELMVANFTADAAPPPPAAAAPTGGTTAPTGGTTAATGGTTAAGADTPPPPPGGKAKAT